MNFEARDNSEANLTDQSSRRVNLSARTWSFIVLFLAILVSGYLSYLKVENATAVCIKGGAFDCGTVLNSVYSEVNGIPIAWLGLATNLIVLTLLLLEPYIAILRQYGSVLVFGIVLFAFMFSVYLVYIQAAVIQAYCPWCLSHEALITVLFFLSVYRVWKWSNQDSPSALQAEQISN